MKAALLAVFVFATAGIIFHFASSGPASPASSLETSGLFPAAHPAPSSSSLSLPLFFEPNQGQTDRRVRFLAHGAGYGLFLTSREAVLSLQHTAKGQPATTHAIVMHLDGARAATIRGAQLLPGKSNYFIGNDPSKWRQNIPQFGRVEYQGVYPGVDLVYYGHQQQLEYDFRVAPGADASQIAVSFEGASTRIESGDLVLATSAGDVRFHAPHIYQPGSNAEITGSFRQIADNKVGFSVGPYDHSRELVIDPALNFSSYLGGSGTESLTQVAVDISELIYVAGSTTSNNFPVTSTADQGTLTGNPNIFIAKIDPTAPAILYATYLGGTGADSLAGIAIDPNNSVPNIYVAGTTTSADFPTTTNAFLQSATGTHGFLAKLNPAATTQLQYSTYLAGNGTDTVSGLAVDGLQNAYVTGVTNSTNPASNGFPANTIGYQTVSASPGNDQFFASMLATSGSNLGPQSMIYSTFFGGSTPAAASVTGGGIAVDPVGANGSVNMYFTGSTNMQNFPLYNAYQGCLNNAPLVDSACSPTTNMDAILVKINPSPTQPQAPPVFSTYMGGTQNDAGIGVAVDTSSNIYVTGSTNSPTSGTVDWNCVAPCIVGPYAYLGGGNNNAFIAKVGNQTQANSIFPLNYFTFLGGSGAARSSASSPDTGQSIQVDSIGTAHVAGTTASSNLPVVNPIQPTKTSSYNGGVYGGGASDAFVALVSTTTINTGNYITYLGGSGTDQGTGIALDLNNTAYVVGTTTSTNFPTYNPLSGQGTLNGTQNAFVTKIGSSSKITVAAGTGSPSPNPVPAGTQVTFTFNLTNTGPDPATNVNFQADVPTTGISSFPTATVSSGGGTCNQAENGVIICNLGTLAVNAVATVNVYVTPAIPVNPLNPQVSVTGAASANGSAYGQAVGQQDTITDFAITGTPSSQYVTNGDLASFAIALTPGPLGYNASITMSETTSPTIITNPAPTFSVNPVVLSGTSQGTTVLNIQTVARPITTGSLLHRTSFYATWLPIGGLSLIGLGIGAGRKRRRLLVGSLLVLLAGLILMLPSCSGGSTPVTQQGGTAAGTYIITVVGSSGTTASHNAILTLIVR